MKFKSDFWLLLDKLKRGEPFAFTRFSDGEILVMQNKQLVLEQDYVITGDVRHSFGYASDDYKNFEPSQHGFVREALVEAYTFKKLNYFVGGICKNCNCASAQYVPWMRAEYGEFDDQYSYANLLVNSNYTDFVSHYIPALKNHKVVMVCSENADLSEMPFEVVKDFRVGRNCIVNDHHLIGEMKEWVEKEKITNHVFLFSASSLSEILIHNLFKNYDQNTYIDIGTTLHKQMKLSLKRGYLEAYWSRRPHLSLVTSCND
jgi:hypothetical protein